MSEWLKRPWQGRMSIAEAFGASVGVVLGALVVAYLLGSWGVGTFLGVLVGGVAGRLIGERAHRTRH